MQDDSTIKPKKKYPKKKRPIIYLARDMRNGMVYVGQTILPLYCRISQHRNGKLTKFDRAFHKHPEAFVFYEIEEVHTEEYLDEREVYWVGIHESLHPNGYNLRIGGKTPRGWSHSLETRQRMSAIQKIVKAVMPQKTKDLLRNSKLGKTAPQEVKDKMSQSHVMRNHAKWSKMTPEQKSEWDNAAQLPDKGNHKRSCYCNDPTCPKCRIVIRSRIERLHGRKVYIRRARTTKGRPVADTAHYKRGEACNLSKITATVVLRIRAEHAAGDSYAVLGRRYGLTRTYVYKIVKFKTWKHVPPEG